MKLTMSVGAAGRRNNDRRVVGLPAALCLTPWDWPLTLAGAVLAGAACVVECALTDRYTRP